MKNMTCIAHRGASGHEPENTLLAIQKALDLGAKWVEIDVYPVENELVVIHVGKCGGSTVMATLHRNLPEVYGAVRHVHMRAAEYDPTKRYVIVVRNPIRRFISAYHWRRRLVVGTQEQHQRFVGEHALLTKFRSVSELADALAANNRLLSTDPSSGQYIHHITEGIDYHLGTFLDKCSPEHIVGVICTETLERDMLALFRTPAAGHLKNNAAHYSAELSDSTRAQLRAYLTLDYKCLTKLHDMGCMSNEQYDTVAGA